MKKNTIAITSASFDPINYAHIDLIERAASFANKLILVVGSDPKKKYLFSEEERIKMVFDSTRPISEKHNCDILVKQPEGDFIEFAEKMNANIIVRRVLNISQFDYETIVTAENNLLNNKIQTLLFPAFLEKQFISQSTVQKRARINSNVTPFVPENVAKMLVEKFPENPYLKDLYYKTDNDIIDTTQKASGLYIGSFDPFTNGHLKIVDTISYFLKKLYVYVGVNPDKRALFSMDERIKMIEDSIQNISKNNNCEIIVGKHDGLGVDLAKKLNVPIMVRGVRNSMDFSNEVSLAGANNNLAPNISTAFLTLPNYTYISSSLVRFKIERKLDVSDIVPNGTMNVINEHYSKQN